jgi:hypothetical protein
VRACGPEIDADVAPDLVWSCASSELQTLLRNDGAVIAHPMMGRRVPA